VFLAKNNVFFGQNNVFLAKNNVFLGRNNVFFIISPENEENSFFRFILLPRRKACLARNVRDFAFFELATNLPADGVINGLLKITD
jgi:hypothetical protein